MLSVKNALIICAVIVILYILYKMQNKSENVDNVEYIEKEQTNEQNNVNNNGQKKLGVYYTEWCGYSKQFLNQLNNGLKDKLEKSGTNVVLVDCEKNKDTCNAMGIEGFPTLILHTSKGNVEYSGQRDDNSLVEFVNSK
jgi:thiol-disulfide isomerase/thioredoxin